MSSSAYLSRSYVISALLALFTLQPASWTVIVSAQCPLSLSQTGCQVTALCLREVNSFQLISRAQRRHGAPHAANL